MFSFGMQEREKSVSLLFLSGSFASRIFHCHPLERENIEAFLEGELKKVIRERKFVEHGETFLRISNAFLRVTSSSNDPGSTLFSLSKGGNFEQ